MKSNCIRLFVALSCALCASRVGAQQPAKAVAEARVAALRDTVERLNSDLKSVGITIAHEDSLFRISPTSGDSGTHLKTATALRSKFDSISKLVYPLRARLEDLGLVTDLFISVANTSDSKQLVLEQNRTADLAKSVDAAIVSYQSEAVTWRQQFVNAHTHTSIAALLTLKAQRGIVPPWISTGLQWLGGGTAAAGLVSVSQGSAAKGDQRTVALGLAAGLAGKLFEDKWLSLRAGIEAITRSAAFREDVDTLNAINSRLAQLSEQFFESVQNSPGKQPDSTGLRMYAQMVAMQDTAFAVHQSLKRTVDQLAVFSPGLTSDSRLRINEAKLAIDKSVAIWPSTRAVYAQTINVLKRNVSLK